MQRKTAVSLVGLLLTALAGVALVAQGITIPTTFVNGTTADANQVNANFTALAANALNRNAGTMLGTLSSRDVIPTADATYDLGSAAFRHRNLWTSGTTAFRGVTYTWPAADGAATASLQTNAAGALSWTVASPIVLTVCGLRLTLTTAVPVTTADVTAATNVYVTPLRGGQCAFYDGSALWTMLTNAEVTVAVPATTSTMYDVFCYNNSGTMACEALAWTNDTTRATALTTQNAVLVKSGATTRRYIGSFRTTLVSGQTEDSAAKRFIWSYYHRAHRRLFVTGNAANWQYQTATWRQANNNTANQVAVVVGVAESLASLTLRILMQSTIAAQPVAVSIGQSSTTVPSAYGGTAIVQASIITYYEAHLDAYPAVGYTFFAWLEWSTASGTTTWYGGAGNVTGAVPDSGLGGFIDG